MNRGWLALAACAVACSASRAPSPPAEPPAPTPTAAPAVEPGDAAAPHATSTTPEPAPRASAPPAAPTGGADDPAVLARAVFNALVAGDAAAYVKLTVNQPSDYVALGATRSHPPPVPNQAKLAIRRQMAATEFEKFLLELQMRGIDPAQATLAAIRTDKAARKGNIGFAEDLTVVLEQGGQQIEVTIDDCVLTPRGWLIADGLKLRK